MRTLGGAPNCMQVMAVICRNKKALEMQHDNLAYVYINVYVYAGSKLFFS